MKEILYNKLVRDKIPQIIEEAGKQCETKILSDTEYLEMLDKSSTRSLPNIIGIRIWRNLPTYWKYSMRLLRRAGIR